MRKSSVLTPIGILLILGVVLIPAAAYVTAYFLPRTYTSQVTMEVKSNQNMPDTHFIVDQLQVLQSRAILLQVIDELGLVDKWSAGLPQKLSKDDAYTRLVGMMRGVQEVRNTGMIIIPVTSTDKQEAADIANTIAATYQKQRRNDMEQQITSALTELNLEVEKLHHKADAAKAELDTIGNRDNIQDANPETFATPLTHSTPDYDAAKQKYIDAKKLQDAATQKYKADKMNLQIALVPAEIWDRAEPSPAPSSPNILAYLMIATGIGFLCALCGVVLVIVGQRSMRPAAPPLA